MKKSRTKTYRKELARQRRKKSIRKKMFGSKIRPRLVVYKGLKNISAQLVDDMENKVLLGYSSFAKDNKIDKTKNKTEQSFEVGLKLGELALEHNIEKACFDRNGFKFHGRIRAQKEGAEKAGLKFE